MRACARCPSIGGASCSTASRSSSGWCSTRGITPTRWRLRRRRCPRRRHRARSCAGLNGARLQQKVSEQRFLYLADRLGYSSGRSSATGPTSAKPTRAMMRPARPSGWRSCSEIETIRPSSAGVPSTRRSNPRRPFAPWSTSPEACSWPRSWQTPPSRSQHIRPLPPRGRVRRLRLPQL